MSDVVLKPQTASFGRRTSKWDDTSRYLFEPYSVRKARLAAERSGRSISPEKGKKAEILRELAAGQAPRDISSALNVPMRQVTAFAAAHGFNTVRNATILGAVDAGLSYSQVSALLGISRSCVAGVVYRAGGRP